jgi:3-oxoacyl-[acyl-carrier-protein] synthase II
MGAICGLGHDLNSVWANAIAGKSGVSIVEPALHEGLTSKIAGQVKNFTISEHILEAKEHARFDRFIHLALHTSNEALLHAGLLPGQTAYNPERMGCIMGVGMGGFPEIERTNNTFNEKGPRRVSPFFIPGIIPNMAPGLASIRFGLKGVNYNVTSACASAAHAITSACMEIMCGRQDVVVTGGTESVICNLPIQGFIAMKALSKRNEEPTRASRPFDRDRDGFVMGEGAGMLVVEDMEKAIKRGATIYAEIVGHGASADAYHITAPHPDGEGASRCMRMALESAGISPDAIGYVNAHGTSTPLGDIGETNALKASFGAHAKKMAVSSTKSMTGHLLGAAGGIESIFCAMALHTGILPPTINLENPDPACDLDYVPNKARKQQVEYALNNSFGFGGTNSTLILKRYK